MDFIVSGMTDIGLTKNTNQDSFNVRVFTTPVGRVALAVLCDGMGGLSRGEIASASVVNAFVKWSETKLPEALSGMTAQADVHHDWAEIVKTMNRKIYEYGARMGSAVGTTVTALLLTEDWYSLINVGDSRAYEIQQNANILTRDQTLVAQEVALGHMTQEQAKLDPRRNVLLECVGATDDVRPDFYIGKTRQDAVYMLCSDGFRHEITPEEITCYFSPQVMLSADAMERQMAQLIAINKERRERDNITVITIRTF